MTRLHNEELLVLSSTHFMAILFSPTCNIEYGSQCVSSLLGSLSNLIAYVILWAGVLTILV